MPGWASVKSGTAERSGFSYQDPGRSIHRVLQGNKLYFRAGATGLSPQLVSALKESSCFSRIWRAECWGNMLLQWADKDCTCIQVAQHDVQTSNADALSRHPCSLNPLRAL
ncbi:hypothetical protein AAFF_G00094090 [Aldrovandia affinis]|uniref:Uncharacterized protein n=1 Tax=Aldrovandia affinis TaxID=143900 RepID=A0AAD7WY99_9TELE|nr:hypothetical protein AAFF_G00094090 [Aldrovandia affinis]